MSKKFMKPREAENIIPKRIMLEFSNEGDPPAVQFLFGKVHLGFPGNNSRFAVCIRDFSTKELVEKGSLKDVHEWLKHYSFSYVVGSQAVWERPELA